MKLVNKTRDAECSSGAIVRGDVNVGLFCSYGRFYLTYYYAGGRVYVSDAPSAYDVKCPAGWTLC